MIVIISKKQGLKSISKILLRKNKPIFPQILKLILLLESFVSCRIILATKVIFIKNSGLEYLPNFKKRYLLKIALINFKFLEDIRFHVTICLLRNRTRINVLNNFCKTELPFLSSLSI